MPPVEPTMRTILVTSCGGPAATSFIRSLRDDQRAGGGKYNIIGTDCNKYHILAAEDCNETWLVPRANDPGYITALCHIIDQRGAEFIHAQADVELREISEARERLEERGVKTYLPSRETMRTCENKWLSYKVWDRAGIQVPRTFLLTTEKDLRDAWAILGDLGKGIWIRDTVGAAGAGSLANPTFDEAKNHINRRDGWGRGRTTAAAQLTERTVTWQSIWDNGVLVCAQGREREGWAFGNRTQSGVTGLTDVGKIIADPMVDRIALAAIHAIDPKPHGILSVDMTYDQNGIPNPTEINAGRFFTTHHFITRAGLNMPRILVQLAFGEYAELSHILNPCHRKMLWIRGIDQYPLLIEREMVEKTNRATAAGLCYGPDFLA